MLKYFGINKLRRMPKSTLLRLSFAMLLLSMQVYCKPIAQRNTLRYSEYANQIKAYAKSTGARQTEEGLKNIEIMETEDGEKISSREIESLDPEGFIPEIKPKPVFPRPTFKPVTPRIPFDEEEILELLQLKKNLITNFRSLYHNEPKQVEKNKKEVVEVDEKRKMVFAELLLKIVKMFLERRQLTESESEESTTDSEIKTRTKRQTSQSRCTESRIREIDSNRAKRHMNKTADSLQREGKDELYEDISCELVDVDYDEFIRRQGEDGTSKMPSMDKSTSENKEYIYKDMNDNENTDNKDLGKFTAGDNLEVTNVNAEIDSTTKIYLNVKDKQNKNEIDEKKDKNVPTDDVTKTLVIDEMNNSHGKKDEKTEDSDIKMPDGVTDDETRSYDINARDMISTESGTVNEDIEGKTNNTDSEPGNEEENIRGSNMSDKDMVGSGDEEANEAGKIWDSDMKRPDGETDDKTGKNNMNLEDTSVTNSGTANDDGKMLENDINKKNIISQDDERANDNEKPENGGVKIPGSEPANENEKREDSDMNKEDMKDSDSGTANEPENIEDSDIKSLDGEPVIKDDRTRNNEEEMKSLGDRPVIAESINRPANEVDGRSTDGKIVSKDSKMGDNEGDINSEDNKPAIKDGNLGDKDNKILDEDMRVGEKNLGDTSTTDSGKTNKFAPIDNNDIDEEDKNSPENVPVNNDKGTVDGDMSNRDNESVNKDGNIKDSGMKSPDSARDDKMSDIDKNIRDMSATDRGTANEGDSDISEGDVNSLGEDSANENEKMGDSNMNTRGINSSDSESDNKNIKTEDNSMNEENISSEGNAVNDDRRMEDGKMNDNKNSDTGDNSMKKGTNNRDEDQVTDDMIEVGDKHVQGEMHTKEMSDNKTDISTKPIEDIDHDYIYPIVILEDNIDIQDFGISFLNEELFEYFELVESLENNLGDGYYNGWSKLRSSFIGGEIDSDEDGDDNEDENEDDEGDSDENGSSSEEYDDEPDGDGGGILGLLAGLSGEGGMSDLGTLLTTVGSIVANLSGGPGFDLDALIGSAVGLFAGISAGDGTLPIGKQIAKYYITGFEGFSGGGAMLNGKFIGDFLNAIIAGSSALRTQGCGLKLGWIPGHAIIDVNETVDQLAKNATELSSPPTHSIFRPHSEVDSEDSEEDGEPMKDSGTFYRALFAASFGSEPKDGEDNDY